MDPRSVGDAVATRGQGEELEVDIVITNHDYADFVGEAIDSAVQQTHPKVNVVVVDDGSTDGSRDLLRAYQDRAAIVLKQNGGQASALNEGMARARGDVVIFLDADDVLLPEAAETVANAFAAAARLSKVQFPMAFIDKGGTPTGTVIPSGHLQAPVGDLRDAELAFPFDLPWLPGGGSAFRADALQRIFPIPEHEYPRHGADWYTVHLTALLGEAACLDQVCAQYRVHGSNAYQPQGGRLDLDHVRDSIAFAEPTTRALERLADQLGLDHPQPILSVSDLANRLISLRLEPVLHPRREDRRLRLVRDGVRAAGRRFDVSWPMKLLFAGWFLAAGAAPRPLVRRLAELLLFPEGRAGTLNRLLGRLRRASAGAPRGEG